MSITVKISGPGQTFDLELHYIQKLLEELGWNVTVENGYPNSRYDNIDMNEEFKKHASRKKSPEYDVATIVAEHCPWGG